MALTDCPACRRAVSKAAVSCPHCGHPLGAAPRKRAPGCASQSFGGCLALLVLAFVLPIIIGSLRTERPGPRRVVAPPVDPAPVTAPAPVADPGPARGAFSPGDSVTLSRPGGAGNTIIAKDEPTFEALSRATLGEFSRLREAGDVRVVPNGTLAVVLESRPDRTRVRVADGPQLGFEGWVQAEFAHPWK